MVATWPHFHDVLMVVSVGLVVGLALMAGVEYAITSDVLGRAVLACGDGGNGQLG